MSRIRDILERVRDTTGDTNATRWSDASLLRRLNEGQYDIAKKSDIFKTTVAIQLVKDKHLYELPDDFIKIQGILFEQVPLPIYSTQQMERLFGRGWRMHTTTNEIAAIVTDRQDARTIRVYPRPFIDGLYDVYTQDPSMFGTDVSISDYTVDSDFGVIGTIIDSELLDFSIDTLGVISDAAEGKAISVEYVRRPRYALSLYEDPELPDAFDTALVRYVTGTALRDDINSQNRAMGNEELMLYQSELADIERVSKQSNTSVAHHNRSEYLGMG